LPDCEGRGVLRVVRLSSSVSATLFRPWDNHPAASFAQPSPDRRSQRWNPASSDRGTCIEAQQSRQPTEPSAGNDPGVGDEEAMHSSGSWHQEYRQWRRSDGRHPGGPGDAVGPPIAASVGWSSLRRINSRCFRSPSGDMHGSPDNGLLPHTVISVLSRESRGWTRSGSATLCPGSKGWPRRIGSVPTATTWSGT